MEYLIELWELVSSKDGSNTIFLLAAILGIPAAIVTTVSLLRRSQPPVVNVNLPLSDIEDLVEAKIAAKLAELGGGTGIQTETGADSAGLIAEARQAVETIGAEGGDQAAAALEELLKTGQSGKAKDVLRGIIESDMESHEQSGRALAEKYRQLGALSYLNSTEEALRAYAKAIELDQDNPEGWNQLGALQNRLGLLDAAIVSFEKVLALGNWAGDKTVIAIATGNLGLIYQTLGDMDRAEEMLRKSLALNEDLGRKEGMASDYGNLGLIYQTRGDLDQAEEMHRKSLALNEELGRKEGMASQYGNLGVIYGKRDDLDRAEEMLRKSLALNEELGRKEGMANQYGNLGLIYGKRDDLDRAEEMHRKSLVLNKELGRKEGMASDYGNLALIYRRRGDLDRAEEIHRKSLSLNEELGRKEGIAIQYTNLGNLYQQKGDTPTACAHWQKAKKLFTEVGMKPQIDHVETLMRDANCPSS